MRPFVACVVLALISCGETKESCLERGGIWACEYLPPGCDARCWDRAADAGKPCSDYEDCVGACEGSGGGNLDDGNVGQCCGYEACNPRWVVVKGHVYPGQGY